MLPPAQNILTVFRSGVYTLDINGKKRYHDEWVYKSVSRIELYLSNHEVCFDRVIGDEAQTLRNPEATLHRVFRLIPTRHRGFCTATPTINRMTDILGFVGMIWDLAGLHITRPSCVTMGELEEPGYMPGEDLLSWFGSNTPDEQKHDLTEFAKLGFRYWLLSPSCMANMSDRGTPDKYSQMLFQATDIFTLRRGMDTMLTLPNGTRVFPRDAVPRSRIINEEIRFGLRRAEVIQETDDILANIKFVHNDAEDDDPAIPGEDDQTPGPGMSISLIRALTLLASCFNAWRMLHTSDQLRDMDPEVLASSLQSHLAAKGVKLPSKRQVQKAILEKDKGESAKLGSELVEMINVVSSDGPLSWIYTTLVNRPDCLAPSGRPEMVWFSLWESPLYLRIVELVLQYHKEGKRVLVMVGSPWTQL